MSSAQVWWVPVEAERWVGPVPALDREGTPLTADQYSLALLPRGVTPGVDDWQTPVVDPTDGVTGLGIVAVPCVGSPSKCGLWAQIGTDVYGPETVGYVIRD